MLMESWAIVLLLLVMVGVFFRCRKNNYAVMTLPLGIVPLSRIFSKPAAAGLRGLGVRTATPYLRCGIIGVGLIAACILFWGLSKNAATQRSRRAYVIVSIIFSLCLALVLMGDVAAF